MDMSLGKLRVGDGQGGLVCWDSWGRKESGTTELLNWTDPSNTIYIQWSELELSSQSLLLKGKYEPWRIYVSDQEFFFFTLSSFINITQHLPVTSER